MLSNFLFRSSFSMVNAKKLPYFQLLKHNKITQKSIYPLNKLYLSNQQLTHRNIYSFSKYKMPLPTDIDTANMMGYINASDSPFMLFRQKLSQFSFSSMYNGMYDYSRDLLFTLANDYNIGIPLAIVVISLTIRLAFIYPTIIGQLNGYRMKQIQPQTQRYKEKLKIAQQSRNMALSREAQRQFAKVRADHGLDMFIPMLNFFQLPFLITWFMQLRDLANLGQIYPQLYNSPFLWITDLTNMDYALPIISAIVTSLSLYYSPSLKKKLATNVLVAKYGHLFPVIPFATLLFTIWFPSTLNIYWLSVAFVQLLISLLLNYKPFLIRLGYTPKQDRIVNIPDLKYVKAIFIQQKNRSNLQKENSKKEEKKKNQIQNQNDDILKVVTRKPQNFNKSKQTPPKRQ